MFSGSGRVRAWTSRPVYNSAVVKNFKSLNISSNILFPETLFPIKSGTLQLHRTRLCQIVGKQNLIKRKKIFVSDFQFYDV